jgi:hypothetical protein
MSQAGVLVPGGTPTIATSYQTDSGVATPAANVLNILGGTTTTIDTDGIRTTGSGNTVTVQLTNRFGGTGSTVGATTADVAISLGATPGVYTFDIQIAGFDSTAGEGVGYAIFGTVRTDGAAATVIGTPDKISNEDSAPVDLRPADANLIASANTAVVRVTGVAARTISWRVLGTFVFVS